MADAGLLAGLGEGLRSGLMAYTDMRKLQNQEAQTALENQMKQKDFDLRSQEMGLRNKEYTAGLAERGLMEDSANPGKFTVAPTWLSMKKAESDLRLREERQREEAGYRRAQDMEYAKHGLLPKRDPQGRVIGLTPIMNMMGQGGEAASIPSPDTGSAQGLMSPIQGAAQPQQETGGVNEPALRGAIQTGLLEKTAGNKATEELGNYQKVKSQLEDADRVFDLARDNATFRGRISRNLNPHAVGAAGAAGGGLLGTALFPGLGTLGGTAAGTAAGEGLGYGLKGLIAYGDEPTKKYSGAVNAFMDRLTKDTAGRVTPLSFEKISAVMPEQGDSEETLAVKRAALHNLIKSGHSYPTLTLNKFLSKNDPLISLDSETGTSGSGDPKAAAELARRRKSK